MKFCPNCGKALAEGAKFCTGCGFRLAQPEPAPVEPAPQPAPVAQPEPAPVYQVPVQPAPVYQAPVAQPEPVYRVPELPVSEAPKKKKKKALFFIIGGAVLTLLIAAAVVLVLLLGGGSKVDEALLGRYEAVSCYLEDAEMDVDDDFLVLEKRGKGTMCLMDDEFSIKWELDGDDLTVEQQDDTYTGTLEDGVIVLDLDGMEYTYVLEDQVDEYLEKLEEEAIKASVGYWPLVRAENDDPDEAIDEETVQMLRDMGIEMYLVLEEDGTGSIVIEEPIEITWADGRIIGEGASFDYVVDGDELSFEIDGTRFVFCRGDGPAPEVPVEVFNPLFDDYRLFKVNYAVIDGEEYDEELLDSVGGVYLESYGDGTGYLVMEGEYTYITYDEYTIDIDGEEMDYYVDGETICMYDDEGEMYFVPTDEIVVDPPVAYDNELWDGDWYGWWIVYDGTGEYTGLIDTGWDAYAQITNYGDGTGYIEIWDVDTSWYDPIAGVDVSFLPGETDYGTMTSDYGYFYDTEVGPADWYVDPGLSSVSHYDKMITISGNYVDPENPDNTMDYYFFLRPWGMDWEDVRNGDNSSTPYDNMMPFAYDDWYLPLLEAGVEYMPYSYEEGLEMIG